MASRAQVVGDLLGRGDGQAVDDAGPGLLGEVVGEPGQPLLGGLQRDHAEPQRLPVQRATQHENTLAHLLGDVRGHPLVGGGGRREHRDAVGEVGQQRTDPAVVGPEVVPPVGDAVGLVDHQQAALGRQPRQHRVAELRVVEPLGRDQQDVHLARMDGLLDRDPVLGVGRVDRHRPDPGPLRRRDLVAHQREQRGDDHGRPETGLTEQQRRHEVDRRLPPPGLLHDQRPATIDGQRRDRRPLVLAQGGIVAADEGAQMRLCLGTYVAHGVLFISRRRHQAVGRGSPVANCPYTGE